MNLSLEIWPGQKMTYDLLGNVVPVPFPLHSILDSPSMSIWQRLQESWASLVTREDREWSQPWNDHKRQLRNYSTLYHSAIKLSVLKLLHNFSRWNCLWDSLTVYFPVYLLNDVSDARTEKYSLDHWVCFDPGGAVDLLTTGVLFLTCFAGSREGICPPWWWQW